MILGIRPSAVGSIGGKPMVELSRLARGSWGKVLVKLES
jgi:hypothetical protein